MFRVCHSVTLEAFPGIAPATRDPFARLGKLVVTLREPRTGFWAGARENFTSFANSALYGWARPVPRLARTLGGAAALRGHSPLCGWFQPTDN